MFLLTLKYAERSFYIQFTISKIVCPRLPPFSLHFDNFKQNTHTCQKRTIEFDTRGKSKILSKKCHLFLPGEINKNENRLLTEICHENTRTYLNIWTSLTIFQRYHLWYPRRLKCLFLAAILNLSGKRGRSKRDNLGFFLILKNECRLIPEVNVFMNIE